MEGPLDPEPASMRISDADRHRVAELLREAAGEGRLDLDELDQRLESTYAARTYADLVPITRDLQVPPASEPSTRGEATPVVPGPAEERHVAILTGFDRKGVWTVPQQLTVVAVLGGVNLDLRSARFAAKEVVIRLNCFLGGANLTVGPDVRVVTELTAILGGCSGPDDADADLHPDSPVVRVQGVAILGGVSVVRKERAR